jgi:hypothetical protein
LAFSPNVRVDCVTDNTIRGGHSNSELPRRHLQSEPVAPSSANAQIV